MFPCGSANLIDEAREIHRVSREAHAEADGRVDAEELREKLLQLALGLAHS